MTKIYECCICHKETEEKSYIRIVKQLYGAGKYNQYYPVNHYDFCKSCYEKLNNWIKKHEKEEV